MSLLNPRIRRVSLRPGAHERAVGEVGGADLGAGQVLHVLEVELVAAVVEHVDHLVREHSLHHALPGGHVLADYDLGGG